MICLILPAPIECLTESSSLMLGSYFCALPSTLSRHSAEDILASLITSSTNGYDGSMMNGLQSLPQWEGDFNNPSGSKLGLLNAVQVPRFPSNSLSTVDHAQNIGSLAGYPFAPYMSDGIGRRKTIFFGATIMCIATALQTASQSVSMFIGARFLIGFGLTFAGQYRPLRFVYHLID